MTDKKTKPMLWTRRDAIVKTSAMLGGATLIGQSLMLAGCEREQTTAPAAEEPQGGLFSAAELELPLPGSTEERPTGGLDDVIRVETPFE